MHQKFRFSFFLLNVLHLLEAWHDLCNTVVYLRGERSEEDGFTGVPERRPVEAIALSPGMEYHGEATAPGRAVAAIKQGGDQVDPQRFDNVTRAWATTGSRRRVIGGLLAAAVAGLVPKRAGAQSLGDAIRDAVASAGNGGVANASANGGAVSIENINSGGNAGNALGIGDTVGGPVTADGGDIANVTDIGVTADGGTAIADASGGDNNLAVVDVGENNEPADPDRDRDEEECKDEGDHCDHNPECCGSLVCCNDHCRHSNDDE